MARSGEVGRRWEVGRVNMKLGGQMLEGGEIRAKYEGVLEGMKEIVGRGGRGGKQNA